MAEEIVIEENGQPAELGVEPVAEPDPAVRWREVILQAHPDVVPELVRGETLDDLLDSVEPAREAFAAVVERLAAAERRTGASRQIPAGGATAPAIDVDTLPPSEMLRRGIGRSRS